MLEHANETAIIEQGLIHGWLGLLTGAYIGNFGFDMAKTGALLGFYFCGSMAMGYTHGKREPTKPLHFSDAALFFPAYLGHLCAGGTAKIRCGRDSDAADDRARAPLLLELTGPV
ncbi:MAG: hypothetical protein NTV32_01965 [Gammaproteobacteria bacterium]|nr:hypothetical protein [Gammaproteobacteria bacterium]